VPIDRLPVWLRRFPADHPIFLVAGRWMPLGNHIVSVVAGMHGVPAWRFTWTTAVGLVPFVLLVSGATLGLRAWT
jgi:membrane protein DedA with SNARE-associated domain